MASTLRKTLPLRVAATGVGTHDVEVPGFSKLRKKHRGDTGYVCSKTFTVDGLDWMVVCHPDGVGDERGYIAAFVELVTQGVAVWAHVSLGVVDWATGCAAADAFFVSHEDPVLFDAGNDRCRKWGTDKLASWRKDLRGSCRYLRCDCLRIECVIDTCHFQLAFRDLPAPKFTPRDVAAVGTFGSEEGADVFVHVGAADPIPAHSSVLEAYAPRFLKKHNLARRRRPKMTTAAAAAAIDIHTATPMRVNVDDMPRLAVEALLQFAYNGSLPIVDGLSGDGYRDMFRHLLLAAKRYGMRRLSAICERVLCRFNDVDTTAAATPAMAHRHGFQKLKEACLPYASHPVSKGYAELWCSWDLRANYCERSGQPLARSSAAGKRSWCSLLAQYFVRFSL